MNSEGIISKVADEYDLSPEQARELLHRAAKADLANDMIAGDITMKEIIERAIGLWRGGRPLPGLSSGQGQAPEEASKRKRAQAITRSPTGRRYPYPYPDPREEELTEEELEQRRNELWENIETWQRIEPALWTSFASVGNPALAPAVPAVLTYSYLQPQIEEYIGQVAGHQLPGWGGYQEGGGGAYFGGSGRGLAVPGITEPWTGV